MSGDVHVRFCEGVGVRLPRATHRIITGSAKAFLEQDVQPLVEPFRAERGLALSREKTRGTHMEEGFDSLGTRGRTYRGKLLCTPAKKNVRSFLDTIRGLVKRHKQALTGNLSV